MRALPIVPLVRNMSMRFAATNRGLLPQIISALLSSPCRFARPAPSPPRIYAPPPPPHPAHRSPSHSSPCFRKLDIYVKLASKGFTSIAVLRSVWEIFQLQGCPVQRRCDFTVSAQQASRQPVSAETWRQVLFDHKISARFGQLPVVLVVASWRQLKGRYLLYFALPAATVLFLRYTPIFHSTRALRARIVRLIE